MSKQGHRGSTNFPTPEYKEALTKLAEAWGLSAPQANALGKRLEVARQMGDATPRDLERLSTDKGAKAGFLAFAV